MGTLLRLGRRLGSAIALRVIDFPRRNVCSCRNPRNRSKTRLIRRKLGVNTSYINNVPRFRRYHRFNRRSVRAMIRLTSGCSGLVSIRYSRASSPGSHCIRLLSTLTCGTNVNPGIATDRAYSLKSTSGTCFFRLAGLLGTTRVGFTYTPARGLCLRNHRSAFPGHHNVAQIGRLARTNIGISLNRSSVRSP